jgi:type VI secretion system protein ImpA
MLSPEVLDFDKILAAIPGELPAGADLRADQSSVSPYHTIRGFRKAASDTERQIENADPKAQSDPKTKIEPADWRPVLESGKKVLAERSKDLEITAYVIEALVRLHGFAGLRDGFHLARELVEEFWDGLYPKAKANDPDVQNRFSYIFWLSGIDRPGTLITPVRRIPLTAATSEGPYRLTHYLQARALDEISDPKLRQQRIDRGSVTLDLIRKGVAQSPPSFYAELVDNLEKAREEFLSFCATMSEKSGYDPPRSDLLEVLESWTDALKDVAADKLPKPAIASPEPIEGALEAAPAGGLHQPTSGAIRNRQDALERLMDIAVFFRTQEPQSIIPFALEQIVHWGKLSLPDLLRELIDDDGSRNKLFSKVGISTEADGK